MAVVSRGRQFTYDEIAAHSASLAEKLSPAGGSVAIMAGRSVEYVAAKLAVWSAGGVSVPLCESHPAPEVFTLHNIHSFWVHP